VSRLLGAAAAAAVLLAAGCTTSSHGQHPSLASVSSGASTPVTSPTSAPVPAPPASTSTEPPPPPSGPLNGFQVADLTFVGPHGWALGTVGCVRSSGRCSALGYSADDGRSWRSITTPPVHVAVPDLGSGSCADPCVSHVRFATDRVGYLFGGGAAGGSRALLTTADGGRTWHRRSGGADALESLAGTVIRVGDSGGCPPGCRYRIQTAPVGGSVWRTVTLPGAAGIGDGAELVRTGASAYLLVLGNPAGGAEDERSVLWSSADGGARWTRRGEPCPQSGGREVDSSLLTSAPDGSVTVLCTVRGGRAGPFTATTTNGGASFRAGSRTALGAAPVSALATASARVVLVSSDDTYRSTDGGLHFARLAAGGGSSPGPLAGLGFASSTVGHAISVDRRSIWVTADGGRRWVAARLR
jgi:photosystem II stability/assembly factor-like uncharacterized protein